MNIIKFYSTRGEWGCFSNFSRHPVFINNVKWPTSEHFYQAQKFPEDAIFPDENITIREKIRKLKTPKEAAQLGRDSSLSIRPDWDDVKYEVMKTIVREKFTQYTSLKETLLSADGEIVEDSPTDYIWGCGKNGSGKNWLGKILMEVRDELKAV